MAERMYKVRISWKSVFGDGEFRGSEQLRWCEGGHWNWRGHDGLPAPMLPPRPFTL